MVTDGNAAPLRFALTQSVAPQLDLAAFFSLARSLRLADVEIVGPVRRDAGVAAAPAGEVRQLAEAQGINILAVNALRRFNDWNEERAAEAVALADYAAACGARALLLLPVDDGSGRDDEVRIGNAEAGLAALKPILAERSLEGLLECVGYELSSLRKKSEAVAAIDAAGGREVFRLVHDTFHHHLAGEHEVFPELTGLVQVSGVDDPTVAVSDMRDPHRVLVGAGDRVATIEQLHDLTLEGYAGPVSVEIFDGSSPAADRQQAIARSIAYIEEALARSADGVIEPS